VIPGLCGKQGVGADPNTSLPSIDWGFVTTPQPGLGNRSIHYARGKTLGGSSALNYMLYHRGTNGSYDKWAREVGDETYAFDKLLPYFQRSTHITPPSNKTLRENATIYYDNTAFDNDLPYHQPLHVSWANYVKTFSTWTKQALSAVGVSASSSLDHGSLQGSSYTLTTITPQDQHRDSSQTSFLEYAMRTTDIKVYTQTMARKIVFANNTATGVRVTTAGRNYTISAKKEIILSAGVFQSPQLLMVSGVGPRSVLEQHEIPIVKDLPGVGQSMMDHTYFGVAHQVNIPTASRLQYDPKFAKAAAEAYRTNATGPFTSAVDMIAFERLADSVPELLPSSTIEALNRDFPTDWPDVEYLALDAYSVIANPDLVTPTDGHDYASIMVCMLSPFSRGNLTISSPDASIPPVINPNWLTDSRDKDQAIASFKRARQIWAQMSNITVGDEFKPGPETQSDEDIWRWIQKDTITIWHASSTCKMGRSDDPLAVVDSKARVYGTQGLRVVDASAFPFLTPGHPQSGIYMLAEKIADDIKMGN
jgi:choline dehydrogenase